MFVQCALRSCLHWHSFAAAFLHVLHCWPCSEHASKKLILLLMEREIVRRGYQISQFLPPIERMEEQQPLRRGSSTPTAANAAMSSPDSSTHIRTILLRTFEQEIEQLQLVRTRMQEMRSIWRTTQVGTHTRCTDFETHSSLLFVCLLFGEGSSRLDAFDSSSMAPIDFGPLCGAPSSLAVLPSIVQLKSLRSNWLQERQRMRQQLFELLQRLQQHASPFSLSWPFAGPDSQLQTAPQSLANSFLQLHVLLSRHLADMRTFLPSPAAMADGDATETVVVGASSSSADVAPAAAVVTPSDPIREPLLDLASVSLLSAPRRSLQQSLRDVHNSIRSAERRVQIALQRQLQEVKTEAEFAAGTAPPIAQASQHKGLFERLRSDLFSPLPLAAITTLAPSAASPPVISDWSAPLSSSLSSDVSYVRHLLKQLHRHCDTLDQHVRRVNNEEGVVVDSDNDAAAASLARENAELSMVSQHQRT